MKIAFGVTLAFVIGMQGTLALAGGPVIVEDTAEVVAEKPATSVGILPLLLGGIILCAVLCGQDEGDNRGDITAIGPIDEV